MHGVQDGNGGDRPQRSATRRAPWPSELPATRRPTRDAAVLTGVPTAPSGRVPRWVLDDATRGAAEPDPWRSWTTPLPRPAPRRPVPAARGLLSVVLAVALSLGAAVLAGRLPWSAAPGLGAGGGLAGTAGDRPTPGHEAASAPLGRPPAAPGVGSHRLLRYQDGGVDPVAYDPCRPVHYVIAPAGAPGDAADLVAEALAPVSAATGLRFVHDGTTDEVWAEGRDAYQPDRYGDRWAPVLVSWATPEEVPGLAGTVAGLGGSQVASAGGPEVYVTGAVTLDAGWTAGAVRSPGGRDAVRAVLMHEFGHVLGLDHVADPAELMSATNEGQVGFGPGDLAGLARLGRGACEPGL